MSRPEYLKAGTILVPKPEWLTKYKKMDWPEYVVTKEDEKQHGTIGDNWMIKLNQNKNV